MSNETQADQGTQSSGTEPLTTRKSPRIGKSFSSRNPLPIGIIGLVFLLVLLIAAFNAASLPLIGGGTSYTAYFTDSANLKPDDDVRIAGVKAGKVTDVTLDGDKVKVQFDVKQGWVGDRSTIDLKLKTLLGQKYLSINSTGSKAQPTGDAIGTSRTTTPFDVYPAFTKLTDTVQGLNTPELQKSLRTLASDFSGTPSDVRPVVTGLSRLSQTISSRDAQITTLLTSANTVTHTLAQRDQQVAQLLKDGSLLLAELNSRRDAIHSLLLNTATVSAQLRGLVSDNQKTMGPLLNQLDDVLKTLQSNQDSLDRGLSLLGPFYRVFNNVVGNGNWFDNYIQNLSPTGVLGLVGIGESK
ncbi:MCE family protein [uncultured Jatrophihabitans sp.]|uniref:MCE family protein n=1 Tax=uncultured Jatrophihabitans sp. TaxID=1610747 RepID=UPI0035C9ED0A